MQKLIDMECCKCGTKNPFCYFTPIKVTENLTICKCLACVEKAGFLDENGDLKKGVEL